MDILYNIDDKQALLNAIITSSGDAIVSKTLAGIITSWNPAAERMFGFTQEDVLGKHISIIIPEDRLSEEDYIISEIKEGKRVSHFETIRKTKSGSTFPISVTISPVLDINGNIIGASKIARDISDRHLIQKERTELLEKLKDLNNKKDEFIALASHELRTPLSNMDAYLQILKRQSTDDKQKIFLEKALEQSKKLNRLISDLMDMSKIESGKLPLQPEKFSINEVLQDCIDLIVHSNVNFDITFYTNTDSLFIVADKYRIEQVITNLLTNAIRYSGDSHKIEIILDNTNTHIVFGVKDYGVGIESSNLDKIFSRFHRVDHLDNIYGLGLGLYLCKQIISEHQGKIWVESEIKKGSTFWVKLPIEMNY